MLRKHAQSQWPGIAASTFTPQAYYDVVQRAIDYIYAGDIYRVNLSQRYQSTPANIMAPSYILRFRVGAIPRQRMCIVVRRC